MSFIRITAPASEPITRTEAKLHLKIETTDTADDTLIDGLISAARDLAEQYLWRPLLTQTWELRLDYFDESIINLKTPAQAITSVKYIDLNGVEQTLASSNYELLTGQEPHRIALKYGCTWPTVRGDNEGVKIRFTCGYTTIPPAIKAALLLIIGHLYENRQDVISGRTVSEVPKSSEYLMDPYRLISL